MPPDAIFRRCSRIVIGLALAVLLGLLVLSALGGCNSIPKPQQGGGSSVTLGGATGPTTVTTLAPQNPQTPSTTSVEKTTVTEYEIPPITGESATAPATSSDRQGFPRREHLETAPSQEAGLRGALVAAHPAPQLWRQTVTERSTTQLGSSWQDTAREVGAKLAAVQPVIWVGALLVPVGIGVGYIVARRGWLINGVLLGLAIAGSGAAMVAIAIWLPTVNPLVGLLLLGLVFGALLVWAAYYKAKHDSFAEPRTPSQPPPVA